MGHRPEQVKLLAKCRITWQQHGTTHGILRLFSGVRSFSSACMDLCSRTANISGSFFWRRYDGETRSVVPALQRSSVTTKAWQHDGLREGLEAVSGKLGASRIC